MVCAQRGERLDVRKGAVVEVAEGGVVGEAVMCEGGDALYLGRVSNVKWSSADGWWVVV
jgi:hypothetical protein